MLTNVDELNEEVKTGGGLGCSEHALVEFIISMDMGLEKHKVSNLNFQANFKLFKDLGDEIPWNTFLRDKGAEKSWRLFENVFL